ncbi:MAG TPA: sugar phosphate isomerase/epimerase [Chloroflexota bacterium]|jgi:inosose dehydratase|nr:sugar phosphate isomerase/epimerase [Chloroflexota bacterium]
MAIRISCHGITWGRDGFHQAVAEISQMGFEGFEAFAFVVDDFGFERIGEFKEILARHGLNLVALYGGGNMHDPTMLEELVARNVRIARFLQLNGADRIVLGPGRRPQPRPTRDHLLNMVHCANEIGRRTLELGVQACIHPHVATALEKVDEIDLVMERVDPRFVALAADTAHFRKGNPELPTAEVDLFRKYADRIEYVHLKDWDPTLPPETTGQGGTAIIRDFVELGQGRVDLKGCVDLLRRGGYDGWLTIELDYTRRTPLESVRMSKEYLEKELRLTT